MRNLLCFLIFSVFLSVILAGFVYFSNPYGLWERNFFAPGQRETLDMRVLHPLNVLSHDYDVVFLGSSRVREGFDPDRLSIKNSYNAGFSGATAYELGRFMQIMGDAGYNGTVVIAVDFFGSAPHRKLLGASINGPLSGENIVLTKLKTLWGIRNFRSAIVNVFAQREKYKPKAEKVFFGTYKGGDSERRFVQGLSEHYISYLSLFDPDNSQVDPDIVSSLVGGATALGRNGARILWFITPTHASRTYLNKLSGLSEHYNNLQKALADITVKVNQKYPGAVELWDVGECSGALKEVVPEDATKSMTYFYDSNHFTPAYGSLLAAALLEHKNYKNVPARKLEPLKVREGWSRNWNSCHTKMDAAIEDIVVSKADARCHVNYKWCDAK